MKIALYIEDGLEQIVLTPESDTEKAILAKLHDGSRDLSIKRGSFFQCRGGWQRYQPHARVLEYGYSDTYRDEGDESTMIVLRKPVEVDQAAVDGLIEVIAGEGAPSTMGVSEGVPSRDNPFAL